MLRSQIIAQQVLPKIAEAAARDSAFQQRYSTLVNRLPIMIRESGLLAAAGFLEGKGDEPEKMLLRHLQEQLGLNQTTLHEKARLASVQEYRHLMRRVLDVLVWYKRLSESKLDTEK